MSDAGSSSNAVQIVSGAAAATPPVSATDEIPNIVQRLTRLQGAAGLNTRFHLFVETVGANVVHHGRLSPKVEMRVLFSPTVCIKPSTRQMGEQLAFALDRFASACTPSDSGDNVSPLVSPVAAAAHANGPASSSAAFLPPPQTNVNSPTASAIPSPAASVIPASAAAAAAATAAATAAMANVGAAVSDDALEAFQIPSWFPGQARNGNSEDRLYVDCHIIKSLSSMDLRCLTEMYKEFFNTMHREVKRVNTKLGNGLRQRGWRGQFSYSDFTAPWLKKTIIFGRQTVYLCNDIVAIPHTKAQRNSAGKPRMIAILAAFYEREPSARLVLESLMQLPRFSTRKRPLSPDFNPPSAKSPRFTQPLPSTPSSQSLPHSFHHHHHHQHRPSVSAHLPSSSTSGLHTHTNRPVASATENPIVLDFDPEARRSASILVDDEEKPKNQNQTQTQTQTQTQLQFQIQASQPRQSQSPNHSRRQSQTQTQIQTQTQAQEHSPGKGNAQGHGHGQEQGQVQVQEQGQGQAQGQVQIQGQGQGQEQEQVQVQQQGQDQDPDQDSDQHQDQHQKQDQEHDQEQEQEQAYSEQHSRSQTQLQTQTQMQSHTHRKRRSVMRDDDSSEDSDDYAQAQAQAQTQSQDRNGKEDQNQAQAQAQAQTKSQARSQAKAKARAKTRVHSQGEDNQEQTQAQAQSQSQNRGHESKGSKMFSSSYSRKNTYKQDYDQREGVPAKTREDD